MVYYDFPASVRYSDLAEDARLSDTAILGLMQEAAARASDQCGFGPRDTRVYAWALCGWKFRIHKRLKWAENLTRHFSLEDILNGEKKYLIKNNY